MQNEGFPKILIIFGTRPEAIKMAPVIKELRRFPTKFQPVVIITAQHREMLDQVLQLFQIVPDYDLNIMQNRQSLFDISSLTLQRLKPILEREKPTLVLVQGDTTTTFAAALASFYLKIPVGHVEAGLRTKDIYQPFPEEMNRRMTSILSSFHFAPTKDAKESLLKEGISEEKIYVTGNTVIDALLSVIKENYTFNHPVLSRIEFDSSKIILVTVHRRESWGTPLRDICKAIGEIVLVRDDIEVVFSVHRNPEVQQVVRSVLKDNCRVHLVEHLDYESFVQLMNKSYLILTDSGGIQEEAPSLGKPVLVLRDVTERTEGIEAGTAKLVGRESRSIVEETLKLLCDSASYDKMARAVNPYGDGQAAKKILQ